MQNNLIPFENPSQDIDQFVRSGMSIVSKNSIQFISYMNNLGANYRNIHVFIAIGYVISFEYNFPDISTLSKRDGEALIKQIIKLGIEAIRDNISLARSNLDMLVSRLDWNQDDYLLADSYGFSNDFIRQVSTATLNLNSLEDFILVKSFNALIDEIPDSIVDLSVEIVNVELGDIRGDFKFLDRVVDRVENEKRLDQKMILASNIVRGRMMIAIFEFIFSKPQFIEYLKASYPDILLKLEQTNRSNLVSVFLSNITLDVIIQLFDAIRLEFPNVDTEAAEYIKGNIIELKKERLSKTEEYAINAYIERIFGLIRRWPTQKIKDNLNENSPQYWESFHKMFSLLPIEGVQYISRLIVNSSEVNLQDDTQLHLWSGSPIKVVIGKDVYILPDPNKLQQFLWALESTVAHGIKSNQEKLSKVKTAYTIWTEHIAFQRNYEIRKSRLETQISKLEVSLESFDEKSLDTAGKLPPNYKPSKVLLFKQKSRVARLNRIISNSQDHYDTRSILLTKVEELVKTGSDEINIPNKLLYRYAISRKRSALEFYYSTINSRAASIYRNKALNSFLGPDTLDIIPEEANSEERVHNLISIANEYLNDSRLIAERIEELAQSSTSEFNNVLILLFGMEDEDLKIYLGEDGNFLSSRERALAKLKSRMVYSIRNNLVILLRITNNLLRAFSEVTKLRLELDAYENDEQELVSKEKLLGILRESNGKTLPNGYEKKMKREEYKALVDIPNLYKSRMEFATAVTFEDRTSFLAYINQTISSFLRRYNQLPKNESANHDRLIVENAIQLLEKIEMLIKAYPEDIISELYGMNINNMIEMFRLRVSVCNSLTVLEKEKARLKRLTKKHEQEVRLFKILTILNKKRKAEFDLSVATQRFNQGDDALFEALKTEDLVLLQGMTDEP